MSTAERKLGDVGTKVLFENEYCRVWEMDLAPGESSDVHRHDHPYALVILDGDPLSTYTRVLETWVAGEKVFDIDDADDRLHAEGGQGAGKDTEPFLCCYENGGES